MSFMRPGSIAVTSWNSSRTSATGRSRSPASRAGSASSASSVASRSGAGERPLKLNESEPVSGLTVTTGATRSDAKTRTRSRARSRGVAISS